MRADEDVSAYVDGYMRLAEAIIEQAAEDYASLYPIEARSQSEFTYLDIKYGYTVQRESILRNLVNSGVRSVVDYNICKDAFEQRRKNLMQEQGIKWL